MTHDELFTPQEEPERNVLRAEIRCMTPPSEAQRERLRALLLAQRGGDDVEFVMDSELVIKQMNGDLIIRSDNKAYPDEVIYHNDESVYFHIIGRVIEKAGDGGL